MPGKENMISKASVQNVKKANIIEVSSTKPYTVKYNPFNNFHFVQTVSSFCLKMINTFIGNFLFYFTVKINLDITSLEITLNYGVVK